MVRNSFHYFAAAAAITLALLISPWPAVASSDAQPVTAVSPLPSIPESASLLLFGGGLAAIGVGMRRRQPQALSNK
jgi:hypothetical protein